MLYVLYILLAYTVVLCWHILYDIRHDRMIMIIAEKFETNWKVCVEDTRYLSQNYLNSPSIVFLFNFYQVCVCNKRLVTCTCIYVCGLVCNEISESYYISKAIHAIYLFRKVSYGKYSNIFELLINTESRMILE